MKRREQTTDEYVRRLPLVSDEQARLLSDSDAKQALFQEITAMTTCTQTAPARARVPRRTLVLAATLVTLGVAGLGWAVLDSIGASTSVGCHTADAAVSVVDAVTGDPIADCAAVWRSDTGSEPPPLVAYDNGSGGIEVVAEGADVPAGWRQLAPGVAQDHRLIELEAALDDHIDGLPADCHGLEAARTVADREVARLGLDGWRVVSGRGEADGAQTCTSFVLEPGRRHVVLLPVEGLTGSDAAPYRVLASRLGDALDEECLAGADAAGLARRTAAEVGIREGLVVHEVIDDTSTCARADVNVAGAIEVTIRGPVALGPRS